MCRLWAGWASSSPPCGQWPSVCGRVIMDRALGESVQIWGEALGTARRKQRVGIKNSALAVSFCSAILLTSCSSGSTAVTTSASTQDSAGAKSAVPYTLTDRGAKGFSRELDVEVNSWRDGAAQSILDELRDKYTGEGGYFVLIECSSRGTSGAANRMATARFAVGNKGEAATGLKDGQSDLKVNSDNVCPVILPSGAPDSLTAQAVADALRERGLPVSNDRDNSGNCASLGCAQMITTDDVTVISWPNADSAKHYAEVFGDSVYPSGTLMLSYAAQRTPAAAQKQYKSALKEIQGR